ncbi:transporter substrate-binding domain-containing protein [Leuconostoc rapi]|uniref:transporter substrate-binding domain-containing protein n=1 Tax=Leuconostoc rapi TaxID=1406906 RepID=UPI00195EA892|nr:transporter substrate-binding domain-containing protein [Leuconostoc rapi]MBM7436518.1 putative amino-acid transport system substrate-binding protein [Leuconostoc rapi]
MSTKTNFIIGGIVIVIAGAVILSQKPATKHAQASNESTKTITLGSTGASFPTSYKDGNKLVGFDVEVAQNAAKKAGYKVKWVNADFDGLWGQLDTNRIQGIANAVEKTPEREKKYTFSKTYVNDETRIAVKKGSTYKKVSDLNGLQVAAVAGSNKIAALQNFNNKINISPFENRDGSIQAVLSNKSVGLVNSGSILSATIAQKKLDLRLLPDVVSKSEIAFAFAKNDTGKKYDKALNKGLVAIAKDGTLKKLSIKYFGSDVTNHELEQ